MPIYMGKDNLTIANTTPQKLFIKTIITFNAKTTEPKGDSMRLRAQKSKRTIRTAMTPKRSDARYYTIKWGQLVVNMRRFKLVGDGVPWPAAQYQKLAEQLQKHSDEEETQCHVCGKIIPVKMAIIREDEVLCEECYAKRAKLTKRTEKKERRNKRLRA